MGARKFMPVSPAIWNRRVLGLGVEAVIVYTYLLTNRHRNSEGIYYLPRAYVVGDLDALDFNEETIDQAMAALEAERLIQYDRDADVVFIPGALLLLPPRSPKQLDGAISKLRDVPETPLLGRFYLEAVAYCSGKEKENSEGESLPDKLKEAFPQVITVDEDFPNTSETAESESESALRGGVGVGASTTTHEQNDDTDALEALKNTFAAEIVDEELEEGGF